MADIPERGFSDATVIGTSIHVPAITSFNVSVKSPYGGANEAHGVRMIAQKTGKVVEMGFYVGVSSGNVDMGIYDCVATTRTRLFSTGSTACGTVNTWQVFGVTGVSVTEGDHFDIALAVNNGVAEIGLQAGLVDGGVQNVSAMKAPAGGGLGKLGWSIAASFPLPATLSEAALLTTSALVPYVYCVVA